MRFLKQLVLVVNSRTEGRGEEKNAEERERVSENRNINIAENKRKMQQGNDIDDRRGNVDTLETH